MNSALLLLFVRAEDPTLVMRPALPYAAIRTTTAIKDLPTVLPKLYGRVSAWLHAKGTHPAGPPLIRYLVVDMEKGLQLEVGFPIAKRLKGEGKIWVDALPAGRYVSLYHRGGDLVGANGALQHWAAKQGLKWKMRGDRWSGRAELYPVDPGDTSDVSKWETEILYQVK